VSLAQFHARLKTILGRAGYSQQQLANALDLHSTLLSNKLRGVRKGRLTNLDIKNIIKTLAQWEAIFSQKEALDLLADLGLASAFFSREEWANPPLVRLERLPIPLEVAPPLPPESPEPAIASPEPGFELAPVVEPATAPATAYLVPTTLPGPAFITRLIGREDLVAELDGVLHRKEARLVSLVGPGGVGKTRLALEVARRYAVRPTFKDGVFYVELDKLNSYEQVMSAIAAALAIPTRLDNMPPFELLRGFLPERETLLVLDNFEHVTGAASQLEELLAIAPRACFLVTSRVNLGIYGELEFTVPPLPLPEITPDNRLAHPPSSPHSYTLVQDWTVLAQNPSVTLFIERARSIDHRLRLTPQNIGLVIEICRLLEGLPLALELAAARTRLLGLDDLLAHLQRSYLEVLQYGQVKLRQQRHRSLQASLDWSYHLLSPDEQKLFCRLAFFIDGFDIETVWAIVPPRGLGLNLDLYEGLENLLGKSLLTAQDEDVSVPNRPGSESGSSPRRYRMLQPIREYAFERLKDWHEEFLLNDTSGESNSAGIPETSEWTLRREYCRFWVEWVKREIKTLEQSGDKASYNRLHREYPNIREVLELALRQKQVETALELVAELAFYWNWRAQFNEWVRYLDPALALDFPATDNPALLKLRAVSLFWSGFLAIAQMDMAKVKNCTRESLQIARRLNDTTWIARNLNCLGFVETSTGNYAQGLAYLYESLELRRKGGDPIAIANGLGNLGVGLINNGDDPIALAVLEEAFDLFKAASYELGLATLLSKEISYIAIHRDDLELAVRYLDEGIRLAHKINNAETLHYAHTMFGVVYLKQGFFQKARQSLRDGLEVANRIGDNFGILHNLAVYPALFLRMDQAGEEGAGPGRVKAARLLGMLDYLLSSTGIVLPPMFTGLLETARTGISAAPGIEAKELTFGYKRLPTLKETIDFVLQNV